MKMQLATRARQYLLWGLLILGVLTGGALRWRFVEAQGVRRAQDLGLDGYYYYVSAAEALLEGRGLEPAYNFRTPRPPYYIPPPLQSLFVAAVYAVRGARDLMAVYRAQIALSLLAGALAFLILRRWAGGAAALAGLWIWMLYPEFIYWTRLPMTESNYLFLLMLTLWALTRWAERKTLPWALLGAALIGLTTLQRPNSLYMGFFLAPLAWGLVKDRRWRWAHAAVFLIVPFLALLPWRIRNERKTGDPVWVSSNGGILFYAVNNPKYDPLKYPEYMRNYPASLWQPPELQARFWGKEFEGRRTYHQLSSLYLAEAKKYILRQPGHFLKNNAIKCVQRFVLVPDRLRPVFPWLGWWGERVVFYGLLVLGIVGLLAAGRAAWRHPTRLTLAVSFAYFTWFSALMHWDSDGRYVVMLRLFLTLFAGAAIGLLVNSLCRRLAPIATEQQASQADSATGQPTLAQTAPQ